MASSCPPKKNAIDKVLGKLSEIASYNPSISSEISDIQKNIEYGMSLRGGKRKSSRRKRRGGMPPARVEAALDISEQERSALLNAMAHIIAVGTITGGSGALFCYISPAIEAYLVAKGLVPMLCSGTGVTGMFEWGFRIVAAPVTNIETCMAIQGRYDVIVRQIIAAIGVPSGFGIVYERAKIAGGYLAYKNSVYNVLKTCVDRIKTVFKNSEQGAEPNITQQQVREIVDSAIEKEVSQGVGAAPVSAPMSVPASASKGWFQGMFSKSEPESDTPPEFGYGVSETFGGARRHRKRKTAKKRGRKSRKTRKHRIRRH